MSTSARHHCSTLGFRLGDFLERLMGSLPAMLGAGSLALACRVATVGLGFLVHLTLARILPLEEYGTYSYVISWTNLLVVFGMLGMDRAALRFPAQYLIQGDYGRLNGFFRRSGEFTIISSFVTSVVLVFTAWWQRAELTPSTWFGFLVAAILLPCLAASLLRDAKLIGVGQVVPGLLGHPLRLLVLWGLVVSSTPFFQLFAFHVIGLQIVATVTAFAVTSFYWRRWRRQAVGRHSPVPETRQWISTAIPLMSIVLLSVAMNRAGTILTGAMLGTAEAALYDASARLCETTLLAYHAVNSVLAPRFSAAFATPDMEGLEDVARRSAVVTASFGVAASVALLLLGRPMLTLFGAEFVTSYQLLPIMLVGPLSVALSGPAVYLLNSTNGQLMCAAAHAAAVVVQVALAPLLLARLGLMGAAISGAIAQVCCQLLLVGLTRRHLGFWSFLRLRRFAMVPS